MAQFGLNVSTSQLEKLKKALNNTDTSKLESTQLTGNAASIFAELNVNSDNAFKDTGLDKILNDIAGKDGKISQNEMKDFLGDDVFSMETFVSVVENAVEEALKDIDTDTTAKAASASGKGNSADAVDDDNENSNLNRITTKNFSSGEFKSTTVEKDENGNVISRTYVKADGSTIVNKYENGVKTSQENTYADGTRTFTELKHDKDGNKIGAATSRYDSAGNLQSITEADYDAKTGQRTHAKTLNPDGTVRGEASYEIQKNADGSYSELRYQIGSDGSKTLTTTTKYNKDGVPQSATNHSNNTVETFKTDENGKVVSSTVKSQDGTVLSEDQLDANGNVLKHIKYTADGQIASETAYTYYDNGTVKTEDTKTYIEETKVYAAANENINTLSSSGSKAANKYYTGQGWGKTGEELADTAKQMLSKYGETKNLCATGVSRTFEMAYGVSLHGNGCDWANNMDNLVSQGAFKEVTGEYASSADLANLPAGAVVCWEATGANTPAGKYGHVAIADGNGGEISDHYRSNIYKSVGGRSDTYRVYVPV